MGKQSVSIFLAVTEVNCNYAEEKLNGGTIQDQDSFRFGLAQEMINNFYIDSNNPYDTRKRK